MIGLLLQFPDRVGSVVQNISDFIVQVFNVLVVHLKLAEDHLLENVVVDDPVVLVVDQEHLEKSDKQPPFFLRYLAHVQHFLQGESFLGNREKH